MGLFSRDDPKVEGVGFWSSFERERQESGPAGSGRLSRTTADDGTVVWDFARPRRRRGAVFAGGGALLFCGWLLWGGGDAPPTGAPVAVPTRAVAVVPAPPVPATAPAPIEAPVVPSVQVAAAPDLAPALEIPPQPEAKPSSTASLVRTYSVQVAAKLEGPELEDLRRQLAQKGYPVFLEPVASGATRLVRVRVGPLVSLAEAEAMSARLQADGHQTPWIATGESLAVSALSVAQ